MIFLIPQRSMYMVQPMPSADSAQVPASAEQEGPKPGSPTFEATGETDTILGYSCKKYVVTSPEGTTEIWATDQLGTFGGFNLGGRPGSRSKIPQGWAAALQGKNVFPMRVIGSHDGKSFRMDVTAVEKRDIPDSEFAPPDGWQKFDMGNFMQGMGAGSFQR
jgi:hypothetical protein